MFPVRRAGGQFLPPRCLCSELCGKTFCFQRVPTDVLPECLWANRWWAVNREQVWTCPNTRTLCSHENWLTSAKASSSQLWTWSGLIWFILFNSEVKVHPCLRSKFIHACLADLLSVKFNVNVERAEWFCFKHVSSLQLLLVNRCSQVRWLHR